MVMGDNRIDDYEKIRQINDNFDPHAARVIRRNAHCPMECIRGFMQIHKMPRSGECPHRIAPVTAMVKDL
jgi:hypothetical protein